MGRLNKRALIRQLQKAGVSSRASLARSLGMSQPTAGKIVDGLLALKILEEVETPAVNGHGSVAARMGRPSRQLQLNRSEARFLGIQLGITGTQLAELPIGATDADDWQVSFRIPAAKSNPAAAWERQLRAAAKQLHSRKFLGVLLSVPGVVDEAANRILFSPNIHWSENVDLAAVIRKIWKAPVLLVQEERALALGHRLANPDCEDFLLVDFGEGVGGAIIVEGKPLANPLPICGEIGHTPVPGNVRRCGCGAVGCMETLVSLRGLLENFSAAAPAAQNSWPALADYISKNGIKPWLAQALDAAAAAIAGSLNVLGLRRVVITGSLAELPPVVMQYLSQAVQNGAMWARFGEVECVSATRRRTAGLVAVGIDRLIVPDGHGKKFVPGNNFHARDSRPARNQKQFATAT
jgi:N-acetylglucosamine repressor